MDRKEIADLVLRAKRGDQAAYERIFNYTYPALKNYIGKHFNPEGEIAQEIAIWALGQAFEKLDTLIDPNNFLNWAHEIAKNGYHQHLREKSQLKNSATVPLDDKIKLILELNKDSAPDPEGIVEYEKLRKRIIDAIEDMPPIYGQAVELLLHAGKPTEKSSFLGIGHEAYKARIRRGRLMLAERLQAHYPEMRFM